MHRNGNDLKQKKNVDMLTLFWISSCIFKHKNTVAEFPEYKKPLQLKRVPNNTNKSLHPKGGHSVRGSGPFWSGQISPVFKDSGDSGWESVSHMVKPHPYKTKDILKSVPAHCPPRKNVNCSAPEPYSSISQGLT